MKKLLFFLLLLPCLVKAQKTVWLIGIPTGTTSPTGGSLSPTYRTIFGTDSLSMKLFVGVSSTNFYQVYTATQSNLKTKASFGSGLKWYPQFHLGGLGGFLDTAAIISFNGWNLHFYEPANGTGLFINPHGSAENVSLQWGTTAGVQKGGFLADTTGDFTTMYYVTPGGKNQSLSLDPVNGAIFNDDAANIGISYKHKYSINATPLTLMPKSYIDSLAALGISSANNGITITGGIAQLGGPLTGTTNITASSTNGFSITDTGGSFGVAGGTSATYSGGSGSTAFNESFAVSTGVGVQMSYNFTALPAKHLSFIINNTGELLTDTKFTTGIINQGAYQTNIRLHPHALVDHETDVATADSVKGTITGLPPTGAAGGDLTGTYPNPTVNTINSITSGFYDPTSSIQTQINGKQATLVSGTNIKTINSTTLLGSGNFAIEPTNTDTTSSTGFATQKSLIPYLTKAQIVAGYQPIGTYLTAVTGTTNRITSTGGTTPAIDISASYIGQSSITTVGTLSAGSIPYSLITGTPATGVSSVSNSDGTVTISPTTGAVVASLATGHANSWSALQTFPASDISIAGTTITALSGSGGVLVEQTSPGFLGTPTAPTPGTNINTTQIPTTAWVNSFYLPLSLGATKSIAINSHQLNFGTGNNIFQIDDGSNTMSFTSGNGTTGTGGQYSATDANMNYFNVASGKQEAIDFTSAGAVITSQVALKNLQAAANYNATDVALSYITKGRADSVYSVKAGSSSIVTVGTLSAGSIPYSLLTGTPTVPTAANPSGTIGLTANNGSAATFQRSDATPALSIAITPVWTGVHSWNQAGIATTSTDANVLENTTASTAGATLQYSPRLRFVSHVWNTTATAADNVADWIAEVRPVSGTTPTSAMFWAKRESVSGTGSFIDVMNLTDAGNLTVAKVDNVTITAPASPSTITIGSGKTFTASNTITFTATDGNSYALPAASQTLASLAGTEALTNKTYNGNTWTAGSGTFALANSVSYTIQGKGDATLVAGTKAISITGVTTSSRAQVTRTVAAGTSLTTGFTAVCTSGTLTITADLAAGTINTADTSTYTYTVIL